MPKPCDHDSYPLHRQIISPCREAARLAGYCLAVHGSLRRDIDWLACPWVDKPAPPRALAELLMEVTRACGLQALILPQSESEHFRNGSPMSKNHGRRCWVWYLQEAKTGTPYIDLSVMPPDGPHWVSMQERIMAK